MTQAALERNWPLAQAVQCELSVHTLQPDEHDWQTPCNAKVATGQGDTQSPDDGNRL